MTENNTNTPQKKRFRKKYLIDKKFQLNFSMLLLVIAAINVFFFSMLFYFYNQHLNFLYQNIAGIYALPEEMAELGFGVLIKTIIFGIVFETIFIILLGIFFSHRIAGPVFNLRRRVKEIMDGKIPTHVKLRKDDMLQDFANDMDALVKKLREDTEEDIEILTKALETTTDTELKNKITALLEKKKNSLKKDN